MILLKATLPGKPKGEVFSAWKTESEGHYIEIKMSCRTHETVNPFNDSTLLQLAHLWCTPFLCDGYILMNKQT